MSKVRLKVGGVRSGVTMVPPTRGHEAFSTILPEHAIEAL
jgi:hypothetical protein